MPSDLDFNQIISPQVKFICSHFQSLFIIPISTSFCLSVFFSTHPAFLLKLCKRPLQTTMHITQQHRKEAWGYLKHFMLVLVKQNSFCSQECSTNSSFPPTDDVIPSSSNICGWFHIWVFYTIHFISHVTLFSTVQALTAFSFSDHFHPFQENVILVNF